MLRAAVALDGPTRDGLVRLFTEHRDASAAEGKRDLAAFLAELVELTCEARVVARREHDALEVDFVRVLGLWSAGSCTLPGAS